MTVTWDSVNIGTNVTLSNGNLTATATGATADRVVRSTATLPINKIYFEVLVSNDASVAGIAVGLCNASAGLNIFLGNDNNSLAYYDNDQFEINSAGVDGLQLGYGTGSVICYAVNMITKKAWTRRDANGWLNDVIANQDPANGIGGVDITVLGTSLFAACNIKTANDAVVLRATLASFTQTPPVGFGPLDGLLLPGISVASGQGSVNGAPAPLLAGRQSASAQGGVTLSGVTTTAPITGIPLSSAIGAILGAVPTPNRNIPILGQSMKTFQGQTWLNLGPPLQTWTIVDRSG